MMMDLPVCHQGSGLGLEMVWMVPLEEYRTLFHELAVLKNLWGLKCQDLWYLMASEEHLAFHKMLREWQP
jgi:hypothetical protein